MSRVGTGNRFSKGLHGRGGGALLWLLAVMLLLGWRAPSRAEAGDTEQGTPIDACQTAGENAPNNALEKANAALSTDRSDVAVRLLRGLAARYPGDIRVQYYLARAEQGAGDSLRAVAAAQAARAIDPSCRPVLNLLGELLEAAGEHERAAGLYADAVEQWPEDAEFRQALCRARIAAGALEEADRCLEKLVEVRPEDAEVLAMRAEVKGWLGDAAAAVEGFSRVVALDAGVMNGGRYRTYADALRMEGRFEEAIAQYDRALQSTPNDRSARVGRAYALLGAGKASQAVTAFRRLIDSAPGDLEVMAGLARALQGAGRTDQAVAAYQAALALAPEDAVLRREAVQVTASLEDRRETALELLAPLLERDPVDTQDLLLEARIMSWMPGRRNEALAVLGRVLAAEPDCEDGWRIARDTVLWSPPSSALAPWLERVHGHFPGDPEVGRRLAAVMAQDPARTEEAIALLDRILEISPGDVEAELLKARLLSTQGKDHADLAAGGYLRAARLAPRDPDVQCRAGQGLLALGRARDALECFVKGHTIAPDNVECLLGRVDALAALDRFEEAVVLLTDAAAQAGTGEERARLARRLTALKNRRTLEEASRLEREGRLQSAETLYRELLKKSDRDVDTWIRLGAVLARRGLFEDALECFERALRLDSRAVGALQGAAGACVALRRYDEAARFVEQELSLAPSQEARALRQRIDRLQRIERARAMWEEGKHDEALSALGELYLAYPDDSDLVLAYAAMLKDAGQFEPAADAYLRATTLLPGDAGVWLAAATTLWAAGRRAEARHCLVEAGKVGDPTISRKVQEQRLLWEVDEAELEKSRKQWLKAAEHYRTAYRMAPTRDFVLKGIGGLYWSNGQVDLASKFYVQAATLYPGDLEANELAVETLLSQDLPGQALALLETNLETARTPELEALYERVKLARDLSEIEAAWARGERALAETLAAQVERTFPDSAAPRLRLAHLFAMHGHHVEAVRWYYKALELDPENDTALVGLIASLQTLGRFVEADDLIAQARVREQTTGHVVDGLDRLEAAGLAVKAEVLQRRGLKAEALEAYRRAVELGFAEPWMLLNIARLYQGNDQPGEALTIYDTVLDWDPDHVEALRGKASALLALDRLDELERVLGHLEELVLPSPSDGSLRAELMKKRGDLEGALALYRRLHEASPDHVGVLRGLVGCLLIMNRPDEVLSRLSEHLDLVVDDPVLLEAAATALTACRRSDLAVPLLRRLDRYWPTPAHAQQLADAYRLAHVEAAERSKGAGNLSRARSLYQKALSRWPDDADLWRGLAGVEASAGHYEQAIRYYEKALELAPDDPVAFGGLASARAATGMSLSAIGTLEDAWERTPLVETGLALGELLVGQQRYAEAREVIVRLEEMIPSAEYPTGLVAPVSDAGDVAEQGPDHFFDTWRRTARSTPPLEKRCVPSAPLPAWSPATPVTAPTPSNEVEVAHTASGRVLIPDIAPELPLPSREIGTEADSAPRAPHVAEGRTRLDLTLVEQLLAGLRQDPDAVVADALVEAPGGWESEAAARMDLPGGAADEDAPFVPDVAGSSAWEESGPVGASARARLEALKRAVAWHTAPCLRLGGWLDARSGEVGTTERVAAFGDLRFRFQPAGTLYFEPFVSPGMVTDGAHAAQGVRVGVGLGLRPGRFGLDGRIGSSALGFPGDPYPVGRLGLSLQVVDRVGFSVEGAVEPVTDTFLSWVGWFDPIAQVFTGKVSRSRLGATLDLGLDGRTNLSVGGDLGRYVGSLVEENTWRNGRLSLNHRIPVDAGEYFRVGFNVTAFGFEKQLDGFSMQPAQYEQRLGGYFSPRLFVVAKARGVYGETVSEGGLDYHVAMELGGQYTACSESPLCSPGMKAAVLLELGLSYELSPGLTLAGTYLFDNVGANYRHQLLEVHLEKRFGIQ